MELNLENYTLLKNKGLKRIEIAEKFGLPEWKLKRIVSKNGWGKSKPFIEFTDCFDTIDEYSAYWAGYLAADGCISDNNDLYLCIHSDDIAQVENFRDFLGSNHSIGINTDKYSRCTFGVKIPDNMAESLLDKFGITPRKSLTYMYPPDLSKSSYFSHFLRGYFDGDGCICESFSNSNSNLATLYVTIIGSKTFIEQLSQDISNLIPEVSFTIQEKDATKTIKFCTNSSFKILDYMYKDAEVYLYRKYEKYKNILTNGRKRR
jgi:hypothetical protein